MISDIIGTITIEKLRSERKYSMVNLKYVHSVADTNECIIEPVKIYSDHNEGTEYVYEVCISENLINSSSNFYNLISDTVDEALSIQDEFVSMDDVINHIEFFENHSEFTKKINLDESDKKSYTSKSYTKRSRNHPWVRKHNFKTKLKKRFLSINPDMDVSCCYGSSLCRLISLWEYMQDGVYQNPRMRYWINPYTKTYLDRRLVIRKYSGKISRFRTVLIETESNNRNDLSIKTNNKIRHQRIDDDAVTQYLFFKKYCSEKM